MVPNVQLSVAVQKNHCMVTIDRRKLPQASVLHCFFARWTQLRPNQTVTTVRILGVQPPLPFCGIESGKTKAVHRKLRFCFFVLCVPKVGMEQAAVIIASSN